jgi:hypothetical protein
MQTLGATQSASAVQLVRHAPSPPHEYGAHETGSAVRQTPAPLQVRAGVAVDPVHAPAAQAVAPEYCRHAPAPSHIPSLPQVIAPWSAHCASGSLPLGTSMHSPSLPAIAHDLHVPAHAALQQTPCAQIADAHSSPAVHGAPGGFGPQLPFTHAAPATQSAPVVQLDRHFPSLPHRYCPHESATVAPHVPSPSHSAACVTVDAAQVCARQIVPRAYSAHAPVPSQNPSRIHPIAPSSGHSSRGSAPTGTFMHVPTLPGCAHDWHNPEQSDRQQMLSKQKPLLQSPAAAHVAPISAPVVADPPLPPAPPPLPAVPVPPPSPVAMSIGASMGGDPSCCRVSPAPPQLAASNTSNETRRQARMSSGNGCPQQRRKGQAPG